MDQKAPKKIRILLIDDDEDDYLIVKKLIEKVPENSFSLEWVADFDAAVGRINEKKHDVYLVDYRLGEHTGLDILRVTSPEKRTEPFILLTGAGDRDVEWRSMKLAASDYLVKGSFDAELLSRTLNYAIQRKELEEQRLKHLVELNRTKDEFISIASHQLRTPATGVKQYLGMLLEGFMGPLEPRQRAMLEKAYESNERQLKIVTDLLKVAQVDSGKIMLVKERLGLSELVEDILHEQRFTFKSRHQTVSYLPSKPEAYAVADRDALRMVIENITDNASKYSEEDTRIEISVKKNDKMISIDIADEGVGISPQDRARLFEKFSRIDNELSMKVGGTGIGLYWAKKIINLHDGDIKCVSREGKGTRFTVSIPAAS